MNSWGSWAEVVMAIVALLAMIAAIVTWFYRRGGHEAALTRSLEDNTEANREVASELRDFKAATINMLHDLDTRVTVLERTRVTVVETATTHLPITGGDNR